MNVGAWMQNHKKLTAAIGGILIVLGSALTGAQEWGTAIQEVVALVLAYIGFQGVADIGKEKAKIEAELVAKYGNHEEDDDDVAEM